MNMLNRIEKIEPTLCNPNLSKEKKSADKGKKYRSIFSLHHFFKDSIEKEAYTTSAFCLLWVREKNIKSSKLSFLWLRHRRKLEIKLKKIFPACSLGRRRAKKRGL